MMNLKRGLKIMCNWLIKFKGDQWLNVWCETKQEAMDLSEVIEGNTDLVFDHVIICIGTGQQ